MKVYTSYFGRKDFGDLVQVSVSLWPPKTFVGLRWTKIAPTKQMLLRYKNNRDQLEYKRHYWFDVLKQYDPDALMAELENLTHGKDCVLLCFEKTGFCHRHLFATWMNKCGYDIQEY